MKLDQKIIDQLEHCLALVEFGEIIIMVHEGKIQGIDIKTRKKVVDKSTQSDVSSR